MFKTTLKLNFSSLTQSYSEIQIGKEHDQDSTTKNDDFGVGGDDELDAEPLASPLDEASPDDLLYPIDRIEKYHNSEELFDREIAVRDISSAAVMVEDVETLERLCDLVVFLSSDTDPGIRMSVVMQLLNIIRRTEEIEINLVDKAEIQQRLLNIAVAYLTDNNYQVRRGSHLCLASTLEENDNNSGIIRHICEAVALLFGNDSSYEYRLDGLVILSRICTSLNTDVLIREFVPFFEYLASDNMFHVRKAFAMCCKELSPAMSVEENELYILPLFLNLCQDVAWGVRKACADVFMDVAAACSPSTRHNKLATAFIRLLDDTSRWVKKAAYQSLGPFITTFHMEGMEGDQQVEEDTNTREIEKEATSVETEEDKGVTEIEEDATTREVKEDINLRETEKEATTGEIEREECTKEITGLRTDHLPTDSHVMEQEHSSHPVDLHTCRVEGSPSSDGQGTSESSEVTWIEQKLEVLTLESGDVEDYNDLVYWRQPIPDVDTNLLEGGVGGGKQGGEDDRCVGEDGDGDKVTNGDVEVQVGDSESKGVGGEGDSVIESIGRCGREGDSEGDVGDSEGDVGDSEGDVGDSEGDVGDGEGDVGDGEGDVADHEGEIGVQGDVENIKNQEHLNLDVVSLDEELESKKALEASTKQLFVDDVTTSEERVVVHFSEVEDRKETPLRDGLSQNIFTTGSYEILHSTPANNLQSSSDMDLTSTDQTQHNPQEVVPLNLIEFFFGMNDQARIQQVDSELPFLCAYSFPGVALTLGPGYWTLLKPLFDNLSQHMHWKIRRALAFSLHDLAKLIGPERTISDILPVFEDFLKDVEDVRVGILSSLSDLFKILPPSKRVVYLPLVKEFLDDHNHRNWRYRLKLTEQLNTMCSFFNADIISRFITPMAIELAKDKVAEVRLAAGNLLCVILRKVNRVQSRECLELLGLLRVVFVENGNSKWKQRLMFIQLCEKMIETECLTWDCVQRECLPLLLKLQVDQVPNIRIAVAKITKGILLDDTLCKNEEVTEQLVATLEALKEDSDNDVRCTAGGEALPRRMNRECDSSGSEEPWFQSDDIDDTCMLGGGLPFEVAQKNPSDDSKLNDIPSGEGMDDISNLEDNVFEVKVSVPVNHEENTLTSNCVSHSAEGVDQDISTSNCIVEGKTVGSSDVATVMSLQGPEDSEC